MRLVAAAHISNVAGTINPVEEIVARAHAAGALVLLDGSQAVPQMPVDVGAIGADFYAWTGHKAYGPTGVGVLHGRRELLEAMPPFLGGGSMIQHGRACTIRRSPRCRRSSRPARRRSPRPSGSAPPSTSSSEIGMEHVRAHERELTAYALERLPQVPGLTIHGPRDPARRGALVSFALDGAHPHDVAEILGRDGVCVRAGHHCAQPLMRVLGVPATTRASFAVHNTREDVDRCRRARPRARGLQLGGCGGGRLMDDSLYREEILEHYKRPHNWGPLESPDLEFEDTNPLCGDELRVMLRVDDDGTRRGRALRRPRLRDQPGRGVDGLRRGQGHAGRRPAAPGPRRSCSTCSASTSPRRA